MPAVTSRDGTRIEFNRAGTGPPLILVDGALVTRSFGEKDELVDLLSRHFTVYSYHRRGRGESGDTLPYAVEREIEDIEALIDRAGGDAALFGHSSGAALAVDAALQLGDSVTKLVMYEAPFNDDAAAQAAWRAYIDDLTELLANGRKGDAVARFMRLTGASEDQIEQLRQAPFWPALETVAPTLAYDHTAILGRDAAVPRDRAARVRVPTLVISGADSFPFMEVTARTLSSVIPGARLSILSGQGHDPDPAVLAPVLVEFLSEGR